jgi:outer membrane murein-binding lipoprotein Lpp
MPRPYGSGWRKKLLRRVGGRRVTRRRPCITALTAVIVSVPLLTGCFSSSLDKVKSDLNAAIADINQQSSAWQATLSTLESQLKGLPGEASDVLAQVQSLLTGSIQAAGEESRCTVDFIGVRAAQALTAIKDRLTGTPAPAPQPHICTTNPSDALQLARVKSGVTHELTLSGYDLVQTEGFGLSILRASGITSPIDPKFIANISPYRSSSTFRPTTGRHFRTTRKRLSSRSTARQ